MKVAVMENLIERPEKSRVRTKKQEKEGRFTLNRRDFLRYLFALGPSILAGSLETTAAFRPPYKEKVEFPNGAELTLVFGRHGGLVEGTGQCLPGEFLERIKQGYFDFLVLEGLCPVSLEPGKHNLTSGINWREVFLSRRDWYRDLVPVADSLPSIVGIEPRLRVPIDTPSVIMLPGIMGGVGALAALDGRPITRREFLKRSIFGLSVLWGQTMNFRLLSLNIGRLFSTKRKLRDVFFKLGINLGKIHPEDVVLTFRNFYFASQLLFLMEKFPRSKVAFIVGGGHQELLELVKENPSVIASQFRQLQPKLMREALLTHPPLIQIYPGSEGTTTEVLVNPYLKED